MLLTEKVAIAVLTAYLAALLLLAGFLKIASLTRDAGTHQLPMRVLGVIEVTLGAAITQVELGPIPTLLTWGLFTCFLGFRVHGLRDATPCPCFSSVRAIKQDRQAAIGTSLIWWVMVGAVAVDRLLYPPHDVLTPVLLGLPYLLLLLVLAWRRIGSVRKPAQPTAFGLKEVSDSG